MEKDVAEKEKGQWSPSFITLHGRVDGETMMDSANAKKLLGEIFENLPTHRRKVKGCII